MSNKIPTGFETMTKPFLERNLKHLSGIEDLSFLQLGAFTGTSTQWLVENILFGYGSTLTDVDCWEDIPDVWYKDLSFSRVEQEYNAISEKYIKDGKVVKVKNTTDKFFESLPEHLEYDFIYIDADHRADSVTKDYLNSFKHLKSGGILAFDDYEWNLHLEPEMIPRFAIDKILIDYADQIEEIDRGWQIWIVKK